VGDHRSFNDRRTFLGVYLHDAWTPATRLTISGGGRYDHASEKLSARAQEVGGPLELSNDSRADGAWSGDASVLFRAASEGGPLSVANLYVTYKSSFKPAAPNLSEAESARILEPERTYSVEGGIKTQAFDRALSLNLSVFRMDFKNLVVSTLGSGGGPVLINAGKERFKGFEIDLRWLPRFIPHTSLAGGYAYHDARFVDFTFVTPDGALRDVGGKSLELVPRNLANVSSTYAPPTGIGGFVAARYQGRRPLNRRNTFFTDSYTEWDAGASYDFGAARLLVAGRNLGDDRHVVTESEIGDSQFYISPPRRVTAEFATRF
jgi:iron complex outermembrane receptor protein